MEKKYYDELISSLEDAVAFAKGDSSRAKIVEIKSAEPIPGCCGVNNVSSRESSRGTGSEKE